MANRAVPHLHILELESNKGTLAAVWHPVFGSTLWRPHITSNTCVGLITTTFRLANCFQVSFGRGCAQNQDVGTMTLELLGVRENKNTKINSWFRRPSCEVWSCQALPEVLEKFVQ